MINGRMVFEFEKNRGREREKKLALWVDLISIRSKITPETNVSRARFLQDGDGYQPELSPKKSRRPLETVVKNSQLDFVAIESLLPPLNGPWLR